MLFLQKLMENITALPDTAVKLNAMEMLQELKEVAEPSEAR